MKDFFELREAYRKPTAAEIAADKAKDRKGKDTSDRYRNMKKKVYGNMMGGLKKEESELTEAPDFMKMSKELLKHKSKGIEYEKAAAYVRAIHNNSNVNVQDKAFMGLTKMLKDMDDFTKKTTITKILKDNGFKVRGGKLMRESLEEDKDKFVVKYAMSKKGPIRTMPFNLLVYAKKFLADKEKEGYKGIISKGGKPVKESVELEEAVAKVKTTMPDKVASGAQRFGLKAITKGGHVSISGSKGKLNDFMRAIIGKSSYGNASDVTESVDPIVENYRTLAKHGMGAETKNSINVGRGVDYYDSRGDKRMGKVTKMTKTGYVVKDEKDGKSHTFAFHDRAKAKELLAK